CKLPTANSQLLPRRLHKLAGEDERIQLFVIGMGNFVVRAFPPFFSVMQKYNVVANSHYRVHIVRNYYRGGLVLFGQLAYQFINKYGSFWVEARIRFIHK